MKRFFTTFVATLAAVRLLAGTNAAPVKLAIISESPDAAAAADLLTAEFTRNEKVQLLERSEIERIYHELKLSAANRDDLKLGQLLGADGGIILEGSQFVWSNKERIGVGPGLKIEAKNLGLARL